MILESKNLELAGCYHQEPMSYDALLEWCRVQAGQFAPYICDVGPSCSRPTTAASASCWKPSWVPCGTSTTASSRLPPAPIRWRPMHRWGWHPQLQAGPCGGRAESLLHLRGCRTLCGRERHGRSVERAAAQGRRRVRVPPPAARAGGPFDCVASRYGLAMQGADKIALTKLAQQPEGNPGHHRLQAGRRGGPRLRPAVRPGPWSQWSPCCPAGSRIFPAVPAGTGFPAAKNYVQFLESSWTGSGRFTGASAKFVLKGAWL